MTQQLRTFAASHVAEQAFNPNTREAEELKGLHHHARRILFLKNLKYNNVDFFTVYNVTEETEGVYSY